ncbi:MAG: trehalose-6-phosphate synthase [Deltaproteobacteria bacterium CG03_land_8_20_14_0_80_45_14]|nr:MAG: trehalose-6-phosphate synthase [Deltaproteobacteria bacterium CG03_land_8_20_14_0_80_45_14]
MRKGHFQRVIKEKLKDYQLLVVSNREPYIHNWKEDQIECIRPASGLTIALDPMMRACGGVWVAHGSGTADRETVDNNQKVRVPPEDPRYELKRVWLSKEEEEGFYYGFANEALWPLCHIAYTRPVFKASDWEYYKKVNHLFAEKVLEETGSERPLVFIQDYHLALLPRIIKEKNPDALTVQFWHIPWPNPEAFRICPWKKELLEGLLGNDLLGFHIRYHCNNFIDTVDRELEARPDRERSAIVYKDKITYIRHFPISIDFDAIAESAAKKEVEEEVKRLKIKYRLLGDVIGVGVDRLDYTKGIPEKFRAIDLFLDQNPEYKKRFVYIQLGAPSREHIPSYKQINDEIDEWVEKVNWRHRTEYWSPILFLREHIPFLSMLAFYKMSHFCIVSSLQDGMNLVAKEYIAAKTDSNGVLILSRFTGASRELNEALLINPYAADEFAQTIKEAIEMPPEEGTRRMKKLREIVRERNIYRWADQILTKAIQIS